MKNIDIDLALYKRLLVQQGSNYDNETLLDLVNDVMKTSNLKELFKQIYF